MVASIGDYASPDNSRVSESFFPVRYNAIKQANRVRSLRNGDGI